MNAHDARRLLVGAQSADQWDEMCDALEWALEAIRRVEALIVANTDEAGQTHVRPSEIRAALDS